MKKVVSYMMTFVLILSLCLNAAPSVNAAQTELKALPEAGQVVSGFKVMEIGNMDIIDSKTVLFEHEKTGAKFIFIQNKDTNRTFDISFKTPAFNDTGVNHILEHITVSGSQKYPMKNVLFTILNQTYSTFINAFTAQNFTTYPVSSLSEDQLLKLAEVYLDCVYHPSVYNDKNIFKREAWRYEMTDSKADLNISGTVYNEMKGALGNITTAAAYNDLKTLFPNSTQSTISGGDPEKVKDLKYEDVIKTHQTYYHPSNSLMVLYGNVDYEKFLKMIDTDYLSKYEKKDIKIEKLKLEPFKKTVEKTYKYPVAAGTNTKNASQIDYCFALESISNEELLGVAILNELIGSNTSALKQEFRDKKLGGDIAVTFNTGLSIPVLTFSAQNTDESKKADFKALVDKYLSNVVKSGFKTDDVDSVIAGELRGLSSITETPNLGVNLSTQMGSFWANLGSPDFYNDMLKNIKSMAAKSGKKYFEGLTERFLINNKNTALVTTVPEAGLAEKQAAEQKKYLSDLKASMSQQQIDAIVKETKTYNEWNSREDNKDVVKSIQAVKISDLPEEVKNYNVKEVKSDGVRLISAEANVGEIESTRLYLDTSAVPADKLHYLKLYTDLLGNLDTKSHTKDELGNLKTRYISGVAFNLSALTDKNYKNYSPVLSASWTGIMGDYDKQIEVVKDILLNTQFNKNTDILNIIKSRISELKMQFTNSPISIQAMRSRSYFSEVYNYLNYSTGLDYYNFLTELEKEISNNPQGVLKELNNIKTLVTNKKNLIITFAGNKKSISRFESTIKNLTDGMSSKDIVKQDYSKLPKPVKREGISVDGTIQYNMLYSTYEKMGTVFSGKYIPIGSVINENYITPKIRFGYGAYDNIVNFGEEGFMLASFRDPNVKETFEVYNGLPEFVKNVDLTQEQLDSYILKSFSDYTVSAGELSGAGTALSYYLMDFKSEDILKILKEIKSVTVQDVKDTASMLENMLKNGAYSTAGSKEKLTENKELYDGIVSVGQEEDSKSDSSITRGEFFKLVLAGAPEPLEIAKQQGLITADKKGNYHENRKLTREELAVFVYKIATLSGVQLPTANPEIADINSSATWSRNAIKALVGFDVIKLDDKGNFNPKGEVTDAYVTDLFNNLNQKLSGK
ncbi:insulinase family protein [Ruminiclostridium cellulolyticum]|uniref:Peptidase M16 domain protein n=1 Tax=Ruminiclostridium cellulolyticum (strain ATCC 35319 / DSM 5812 / JCM 6584 / H10) TaxID=394503 RepID=B8I611_RUMCH|nr:insulinase family protein [Ruminiclostridium cellulolyticum]ACL76776.1 peptidase M16 domain protein [Ruminiclostridium cellulolyticum H10]